MTLQQASQEHCYSYDDPYGIDDWFQRLPMLASYELAASSNVAALRCYVVVNPLRERWFNLFIKPGVDMDSINEAVVECRDTNMLLENLCDDCMYSDQWLRLSLPELQQLNCKPWANIPHLGG